MCWLYNPTVCDNHECIKDCDKCSYADRVIELEDEEYSKPIQDGAKEQKEKLKKWLERLNK